MRLLIGVRTALRNWGDNRRCLNCKTSTNTKGLLCELATYGRAFERESNHRVKKLALKELQGRASKVF